MARFRIVPPETHSDTANPESIAIQVLEENSDLAKKYASGDMAVLSALQAKAIALAAGRFSDQEVQNTLMRKLGASI